MSKEINVHGSIGLLGDNAEVINLGLEHPSGDPPSARVGEVWLNDAVGKLSFAKSSGNQAVIKRVADYDDVTVLLAALSLKATPVDIVNAINNITKTTITNNTPNNFLVGHPICLTTGNQADLAQANDATKFKVIGFVSNGTIVSGNSGLIQQTGIISAPVGQWGFITGNPNGLVPNTKYYLDITSGNISTSIPNQSGCYKCPIGFALSNTDFLIQLEQVTKL